MWLKSYSQNSEAVYADYTMGINFYKVGNNVEVV